MVKYAATLALLAVSVLCVTATVSLVRANTTLTKLDKEIDELHRLTLEAGLTAMEARKASVKESNYLDTWNRQISVTMVNVNDALRTANSALAGMSSVSAATVSTLQTTQVTVASLQAPIDQASVTLTAATASINDLDALIRDPALTATLANVQSTTGHLDATAADVQQEVHSLTHPTLLHKIWGGLLDVAHVFNPL